MAKRKFSAGDPVRIKSKSGWYGTVQGDTGVVDHSEYGSTYITLDKDIPRNRRTRYFASSMLDYFDIPILGDDDEDCI